MGVMRDMPAVNANEIVYRNALILAILLVANSFYHTSAPRRSEMAAQFMALLGENPFPRKKQEIPYREIDELCLAQL